MPSTTHTAGSRITLGRRVNVFMTDDPTPLVSIPAGTVLQVERVEIGMPAPLVCRWNGVEVYISPDDL